MFEDDYDLLFDPARIPQIEGSRLWTSLSNFVTGNEQMFSNVSAPYILIGGATNLSRWYPGFVYDRQASKTPLYTGLLDPFGNQMYGEATRVEIDWIDDDNNGVFDRRIIESESRAAFDHAQVNDFYVGIGTRRNNMRFGLGYSRVNYKYTTTNPDDNFSWDFIHENLNPNEITHEGHARFGGDDIYKNNENEFILSAWLDRERMAIGLSAEVALLSWGNKAIINGDSSLISRPNDTTTWYTGVTVLDSTDQPGNGMRIALELKDFYNYNEYAQGRFYLRFFMENYGYTDGAMNHYHNAREAIYDDFLWVVTNDYTYYDGGGNQKGLSLGTKHLFQVSEKFRFGLGAFFTMTATYDSTTSRDTMVTVTTYDDNDGMTNDPDDYVQTVWSSQTWMTRSTGSNNSIMVPIGVEFQIANPVCFRLGAAHTLSYVDNSRVTNLISFEPERTRTVDGTGAVTESMVDPGQEPVGSEENTFNKIPSTNYFYGIGWKVNRNFQIDLMGFANLTNLSNWRLSATLIFD